MNDDVARRSTYAILLGVPAVTVLMLTSLVSGQPGAAAHLEVDGGVAQFMQFVVEPSERPADDAWCAGVDERAGAVHAKPVEADCTPSGTRLHGGEAVESRAGAEKALPTQTGTRSAPDDAG